MKFYALNIFVCLLLILLWMPFPKKNLKKCKILLYLAWNDKPFLFWVALNIYYLLCYCCFAVVMLQLFGVMWLA